MLTPTDRDQTNAPADRPRLLASGVDSLYVSYYLDLTRGRLNLDDLERHKLRLQDARGVEFAKVQLGSETFAVLPYGRSPYRWLLRNEVFEIALSEKASPCCHVQFFSEGLWTQGWHAAAARFDLWRESMALRHVAPEVVSRADWAFDYDVPVIDFDWNQFVSRSRKDSAHRFQREVQTFTFGRGDVVIRVYDKVAEIAERSQKHWFHQIWKQAEHVWRVEFQVRRDRLHDGGIDTLDDLGALQADLLRELAHGHTTLRRPSGDSNRARWPLHPLWRALQADIAALPQTGLAMVIDPVAALEIRAALQARSLHGALKGLAAVEGARMGRDEPITLQELLAALPELLRPHHNSLIWRSDLRRRLDALRLGL